MPGGWKRHGCMLDAGPTGAGWSGFIWILDFSGFFTFFVRSLSFPLPLFPSSFEGQKDEKYVSFPLVEQH